MAIPIEKESKELYKETHCYEQCYFCKKETDTWHMGTNQPVCPLCSKEHKVSELPKAHPDYKKPKNKKQKKGAKQNFA